MPDDDAEYYPEYSLAEDAYDEVKALFLLVQDLSMAGRAMVFYSNNQLAKYKEQLHSVRLKAKKLQSFVQQTLSILIDAQVEMDDKEAQMRAAFEPQQKKDKPKVKHDSKRQTPRVDDRTTRPAKNVIRKAFNLNSLVGKKVQG